MTSQTEQPLSLKTVQTEPFNAEAPVQALMELPTPTQLFYVRSNFSIPQLDRDTWELRIGGAVTNEITLRYADLAQFESTEAMVLLECAGNARRRMVPVPSGVAWDVGAVSTARFRGVRLADVLRACGVKNEAAEVVFAGHDSGEVSPGRLISFERSLPLEKCQDPSVLLAYEMNGEPLPPEHGYPLRLLVPRWYAVASVKWLREIRVVTEPFTGHFQTERYVYLKDPIAPDHTPVRETRVRALIATPADQAELPAGMHVIRGIAWSGTAPIESVEVSVDGGAHWQSAELGQPAGEAAPTPWSLSWHARPGRYNLLARAEDAAGQRQPATPVFNQLGYGNNVVHALQVTVTG